MRMQLQLLMRMQMQTRMQLQLLMRMPMPTRMQLQPLHPVSTLEVQRSGFVSEQLVQ